MNLQAVFSHLKEKNIAVAADNGELVVHAPHGAVDAQTLALLKAHKPELLIALAHGPALDAAPAVNKITPAMLPLVDLNPAQIDRIVDSVPQGVANIQDIYPLAPLQEGILFHHLLDAQGDTYLLRTVVAFDGREGLDNFLLALQAVISRHDILRSAVRWQDLPQPVQVVHRQAPLAVEVLEPLRENDALRQLLSRTDPQHLRLDLQRAPLLAAYAIADVHANAWLLALLSHHIVCDHISLEFIIAEIRLLLQGRADELPVPLPYRNFIAQARAVSDAGHEDYFRRQLGGIDAPTAPFGQLDVQGGEGQVTEATRMLDEGLARRLGDSARRRGVSVAVLFHVAWALVLARCCDREEVVFGTVLTGRLQGSTGADRVIGMFINTLPIRISLAEGNVRQIVDETRRRLSELLAHEQAALALAQRCSGVAAPLPLFTTLLNYRHSRAIDDAAAAGGDWQGMRVILGGEERTNYPITVSVDDFGAGFGITVQCVQGIDPERMASYLSTAAASLVEALAENPQQRPYALDVIPGDECRQLLFEFNDTDRDYPRDALIHQLFEAQVEQTPDSLALIFEASALTYRELNARANRLAHSLLELGVRPDDRVAVCAERSVEMVVGLLAILKAGGAYVPLDPAYPPERLTYMLDDCSPVALLTQQVALEVLSKLPGLTVPLVVLDAEDGLGQRADGNPDPAALGLTAGHLAYVIYTSGSTGLPKGVMNQHDGVVNRLLWAQSEYRLGCDDRVLQKTPFSFDVSVWEFFLPLLAGAALIVARPQGHQDPHYLATCIESARITTLHFVPSMLGIFLDQVERERCSCLRRVLCSGEALPYALQQRFLAQWPDVELHNLYGPTEAAIDVTSWHCRPGVQVGRVPIGRPIANIRIYILNERLQPAPLGVPGEIHIGGVGVARGYLNRPELTEERFIRDPFSPRQEACLYKTGDLGRWLPDGNVEYLGRNDFQVKIRGFRIELGEIEARLAACPGVREAVVTVHEDQSGDKRLVAYWLAGHDKPLSASELRDRLAADLPDYMLPNAFVMLPAFPLSANGKLDRRALPVPDGGAVVSNPREIPQGPLETAIADIWQALLGLEAVGRHDDFFAAGGHSLLAVQLIARLRQTLNVEVALRDFFAQPTPAGLARVAGKTGLPISPPILPADRSRPLPLSWAQQRLWFLDQLDPAAGMAYHLSTGVRLQGRLDHRTLQAALDRISARHESLRTRFVLIDDRPIQVIAPADTGFKLLKHDLSGAGKAGQAAVIEQISADETRRPFDLSSGPLIRGLLLQLAEDDYILRITQHHIISDGWSMSLFVRELNAIYAAFSLGLPDPLPEPSLQYADYAVWQRQWLQGETWSAQSDFWRDHLADAPELLELPTDHARRPGQSFSGGGIVFKLPGELTAGLRQWSREHGATLFMTLLCGWAVLMARLSGQREVVIGTPVANRQHAEIEPLIGFFVNTLALRVVVKDDPGIAQLLKQIKASTLSAYAHQELPFEQVVEAVKPRRSMSYNPIFQVMLALDNTPKADVAMLPGLTLSPMSMPLTTTQFDLALSLREVDDEIVGSLVYASDLFESDTVERWVGHLQTLLAAMIADDRRRVSQLPLLSPTERRRIVIDWNTTQADDARDKSIQQWFEEQAEKTPDAIAVVFEGVSLTYAGLNAKANRLAHFLREQGAGPDVLIGLCVERSLAMLIGLLGILKAGGAYVPLDPEYPEERLVYMVNDTETPVVLTQERLLGKLSACSVAKVCLDRDGSEIALFSQDNPMVGNDPLNAAYVIYTSGSTGKPKAVVVSHRNTVHSTAARFATYREPIQVFLLLSSYAFDSSVAGIFWTLLQGGCLCLPSSDEAKDPAAMAELIRRQQVSHLLALPSLYSLLLHQRLPSLQSLKTVVVAGEACSNTVVKEHFSVLPEVSLYNEYGPTEGTVWSTVYRAEALDVGRLLPIGRPIANVRLYLLDNALSPVPVGVAGELYIGGEGVVRGYLKQPALSAERFIPDPFGSDGGRLYKTGDLARYRADGNIEFLERTDHQVKIRGLRVELGEIEARLLEHLDVHEAVVAVREDTAGNKTLTAYIVGSPGNPPEIDSLRAHIKAALPDYMLPNAFVLLEAMPLSANGKLDRKALPVPEVNGQRQAQYSPPGTETELMLSAIWAEVLALEKVGITDDFFELGGHSLLAMQLISRMCRKFDIELPVRILFEAGNIENIAKKIDLAIWLKNNQRDLHADDEVDYEEIEL